MFTFFCHYYFRKTIFLILFSWLYSTIDYLLQMIKLDTISFNVSKRKVSSVYIEMNRWHLCIQLHHMYLHDTVSYICFYLMSNERNGVK